MQHQSLPVKRYADQVTATASLLAQTEHRPYALPRQPWALSMQWKNLLFMHWPMPVSALHDLIPAELELDTFDGSAWLGIVPFEMYATRPRFVPMVPPISNFPELNVRTYVTVDGKAGVWFFSLDAQQKLAVRLARTSFNLPYFDASMSAKLDREEVQYSSLRTHKNVPNAMFEARYKPTSEVFYSQEGTLEYFLTERYCLYSANRKGQVLRGDIHHLPWALQHADAEIIKNTMTELIDVGLPAEKPLLHFAKFLDVRAWLTQPIKP